MIELDEFSFWVSGNTPSSKNNRRWTGTYFIASKATMVWRRATKDEWINQKEKFIRCLSLLTKPYYIELTFYRKSKHRFDYINIAQGVLDEMTTHGWIDDDNADEIKPYFGDYVYSKRNPGVLIRVLTIKPQHNEHIQTQ